MSFNRPPHPPWIGSQNGAQGCHWYPENQYHNGPGQHPNNNWPPENQYHNGPGQYPNNNQHWQGGSQDWMNGPPQCNNFGRNVQWGDNYPHQGYGNYPPQRNQQFNQNSHPPRDNFYLGGNNHSHRNQSSFSERFNTRRIPKLEVIDEDHDREFYHNSQSNHNRYFKEPKVEPQENWVPRDGYRNQSVPQNKTTVSMNCLQPKLKNLMQQIKTPKPIQQPYRPITDVWHNNNHTNAPLNQRNDVVANTSTNVRVQHSSSANDGVVAVHQKGPSTQKNLKDKVNKSASVHKNCSTPAVLQNENTPSSGSSNTPTVLQKKNTPSGLSSNTPTVLQSKSTPSGELWNTQTVLQNKNTSTVRNVNSVPKLTLQKSSANPKDWSIRKQVDSNQQSSDPSHTAGTKLIGNSSSTNNSNLNPTNSKQLVASSKTTETNQQSFNPLPSVGKNLLGNSSVISNSNLNPTNSKQITSTSKTTKPVNDRNQLEKHEAVSALCHNAPIVTASSLYAQSKELNRQSLDRKTSAVTNNSSVTNSSTSSKESHATLKSVSVPASQHNQISKLNIITNSFNDKEKESVVLTQQNTVPLASNESKEIACNALPVKKVIVNDNSDSDSSDDDHTSVSCESRTPENSDSDSSDDDRMSVSCESRTPENSDSDSSDDDRMSVSCESRTPENSDSDSSDDDRMSVSCEGPTPENSDSNLTENDDDSTSSGDRSCGRFSSSSEKSPPVKKKNDAGMDLPPENSNSELSSDDINGLPVSSKSNEKLPTSSEKSSLSVIKKSSAEQLFASNPKKPRIISKNANNSCPVNEEPIIIKDTQQIRKERYLVTEEIVEISDEEDDTANTPTPQQPSTSSIQSTSKIVVSASSLHKEKKRKNVESMDTHKKSKVYKFTEEPKAKVSSVDHQKLVTAKSRVESRPIPVNQNSKEKTKPIASSSTKNSAPIVFKEALPTHSLPSQHKHKLENKLNDRKPVVIVERLTPAEISKFSKRSAHIYETDVISQVKYFVSLAYYYLMKDNNVSLTCEVDDPKDLCNKVLYISNANVSSLIKFKYLQENSDHNKITYKTLSNPEFDIRKMYKEFIDFRRNSSKLNLFLILTNLDVNGEAFRNNRVAVTRMNNRYTFSVKEGHELHKKFLNCLTLPSLAELLAESIKQKKNKNFNTELIKKYHLALVKEKVLVIQTEKRSNGKVVRTARFHPDFISRHGLSNGAKHLHRHLLKSMSTQPTDEMYFDLTSDHFGKDCNVDPKPEVENLRGVAEALVYQDKNQLVAVKSDLKKIMSHILVKEDTSVFGFSRKFFNLNEKLPGNLNTLRRQVQIFLQCDNQDFNAFCNKKISIKDFCTDHPVQKLPDENSEDLFKEFYSCLAFEKAEVYAHMLDEDILKIDNVACANAVQEEMLERIKMQNSDPECLVSVKNLIAKHKVTSTLTKLQPRMDVEFSEKVLNDLQCKIPQRGIVLCVTKSLVLSKLKLQQLFSSEFKFLEGKDILYVTNKTLLEMTSDVLKALAHKSTNILLVQWSEEVERNGQLLAKIMKSLQIQCENSTSMKSVIIIGDQKSCSSLTKIIDNKIIDDERSFDLSEDSKAKLLEVDNVSLQHRRLALKSLLPDEHISTLLENPEILRLLLTGKLIIGRDIVRPSGYKEPFFKAQIKQCIVINPAIFHEHIDDTFLIRNIDRKDLENYVPTNKRVLSPNDIPPNMRINARFILLGFNVPVSFFDAYAEKNHHQHNVHLLRYESGSFVWEKTRGNNSDLLRHRLEDTNDLYKSQKTMDVVKEGPKTVIICGEAGSGKSVCLYDIARKTKYLYKTSGTTDVFWPLQVSLDCTRLSRFVKRDTNIPLEFDFVEKFLPDYLDLDEVQSKLLVMILKNQLKIKLVLLFDNYEELPSSYRRFVVQLLQELQISFCERVYVTSSPSTRSELEETLAVFAYILEFSEVENVQFLQSFWSKAHEDVDFTNEAGEFIGHYGEELTATPLQLRMLAAMYTPNEEEDEEFKVVESREDLYKLYVEYKGLKDEESASLFSLRKILNDDQLKTLHLQDKNPKKSFTMPDDLRHRTFYEYFAAKYLATKKHTKCIDDLLDSASPLFFETYFAQLNAGDETTKVIGEFAVNGHLNVVKMMLSHCQVKIQLSNVICSDTPNAREVVRFLLNYYNDTKGEIMLHGEFKKAKYAESSVVRYVNRREKPRKETPLEVAAKLNKIPIACELLLKGANIKSVNKEFTFEIARYIAYEMCKPEEDSAWLRPIAEKLLKLQPTAVAHLNKTSEYPRLLSYFFTHGRVELVNLLLKNDRERYNVLVAKVNDKSPLDLVNESRVLSDDERLEIAKYIVSNVGDDLERRDRFYLGGVLKTAAECNHERTFEYFIGKYPEKHMGFLENAMRSNRLDLIKFLMRKTDRMMYPEDNTALHKAVSLGVSPMTINFLVNRGGIDNKNKNGETPLCVAFKEGQELELVEYLIKKDAHLYSKDELGLYPWCYAILNESKYTSEDQSNIMKYLQDRLKLQAPETEQKISFESDQKRKEVAKKVRYFQKPESFVLTNLELHMALKFNDESWIKFLIQQGANVNHMEADGRTPLYVAIEFKRYKLAKMLLDHGTMFNVKDKKKLTPLKLLLANDDKSNERKEIQDLLETATELFNGNEKYTASTSRHVLNCRDKYGRTLLHVAAENGNRVAIRDIIKQSREHCIANNNFPALDVNAKDSKGNTALNLVKSQNVDVAKELLLNGAIFEPATTILLQQAGKLFQAVKDKDVEKVKELVRIECLTNARDQAGKSCLHWAASYDSREIVQLILAVRVSNVDAADSSLRTPLHYAVENDNIASVLLLLKAGASYDVKDKLGRRPFDVDDKKNESVKLLCKIHQMFLDIKSDEPRIMANDNPEALLEYLMEIETAWSVTRDVVVNITDSKKNTLLHTAARYDFTSVVENLLKQGAIYNAKNKWKKTPESMAISTGHLFKCLTRAQEKLTIDSWMHLDPELVVNVRFNSGYTLLHDCSIEGRKEEVRWLVENGADVKVTTNRGIKVRYNKDKYPEIFDILGEV